MKLYCCAVVALLLCTFCSVAFTQTSHEPEKCCFSYFKQRVPERVVQHIEMTNPACKIPGVILHTKKHLEICADPSQPWVQKLMDVIKNRMLGVPGTVALPGDMTP